MVKPQIALVPAAGLLFWAACRRERWRALLGFAAAMAGQLALAEYLLPGWLAHFAAALRRRRATNPDHWLPELVAGSPVLGAAFVAGPLLAALAYLWCRHRAAPIASAGLLRTAALGFAVGLTVVPDVALYNRALLLMPILALAAAGPGTSAVRRATSRFAALLLVGPVAVMGTAAWLRWLMPGVEPNPLPLLMVDAIHSGMPVLLLPAFLALALDRGNPPEVPGGRAVPHNVGHRAGEWAVAPHRLAVPASEAP
jgi:hypothetical protein